MNEEKLKKIMDFIESYVRENNGDSPSLAEIMAYTGMVKSTAYRHIIELERRGMVSYSGKNTLEIAGQDKMKSYFCRLPIYGIIPCGSPEDYRQDIQGHLAIPEEWVEDECYLLRASGDSMKDIGIDEGDLVIIKRCETASDSQIIAALTEDGTTLKRYKIGDDGRAWLLAENKDYPDSKRYLYPTSITVQGVALKIIKDVR
jgi:repressor LexA